jgi:hypothetical protein
MLHVRTLTGLIAILSLVSFVGVTTTGCNSGKGSVDGDGDDDDDDDDDDGGFDDPDTPVGEDGTITCSEGSDSSGYLFFARVEADDPQGVGNLADIGSLVRGYDHSGTMLFEDPGMVCADGECVASFRDGLYPPVTCDFHDDYEFTAVLVDVDGYQSDEIELVWFDS